MGCVPEYNVINYSIDNKNDILPILVATNTALDSMTVLLASVCQLDVKNTLHSYHSIKNSSGIVSNIVNDNSHTILSINQIATKLFNNIYKWVFIIINRKTHNENTIHLLINIYENVLIAVKKTIIIIKTYCNDNKCRQNLLDWYDAFMMININTIQYYNNLIQINRIDDRLR